MSKLVHGQYNEEEYEVLIQHVESGEERWKEVYRRADFSGEDPKLIRKWCWKTCREVAEERGLDVGQVMYWPRPIVNDGDYIKDSEVPAGHESW